jgi:hypothetical protein
MTNKEEYERRKAAEETKHKEHLAKGWRRQLENPDRLFQGLLVLFTFGLVTVGALQWQTLDKTDDTFRIGQRPWVTISGINVLEGTSLEGVPRFKLGYVLKNIGHLPAYVAVSANIIVGPITDIPTEQFWAEQRNVCRDRKADIRKRGWVHDLGGKIPFVVFPNDTWPYHLYSTLAGSLEGVQTYRPDIMGCIIYQSTLDEILHQAPFFGVISVDDGNPDRDHIPELDKGTSVPSKLVVKAISMTGEAD